MRRFFIFLSLTLWSIASIAQQSVISVMQYNLLQYGNYQGYGGCSETTNNTQRKDECIRTIMDLVKPDILTVCEFGATQQLQNDFLKHNLNITPYIDYWKSDNILNYANSNIINHIFYDSRKMEMKKHEALRTYPRDTDVYELYLKTSSLVAGDTIKLVCIVTHPKAGSGADNEASRLATMQTVMDYVNRHYVDENVLIMGDFNMYRASEGGYQLLTKTYSNNEALFVDPLFDEGGVGSWNNNSQFAQFHTQSTRTESGCFSGGGLDDRFDFILFSDEISVGEQKIRYIDQSYYAVGNDGRHFNQNINQNGNSAVSEEVAQALYDASDHLPVAMRLVVNGDVGLEENVMADFQVYPNPTMGIIHVETPSFGSSQEYRIANMLGQTMMMGVLTVTDINVSGLPNGLYFISLNGVTRKFIKQ
ncbi:MAG: T9SS type A sorting domain-containing protein [Bacteroidales bacterium]|nr:T9SS type A sorting domain-containing protein [Bacteroidales bacterium]